MRPYDRPTAEQPDAAAELDAQIANPRPLIIERGELQTPVQRWGYRSLTVIGWAFWIYLFLPLVSVMAWVAGLTWIYLMLVQGLELAELWVLLKRYGSGIGILGGIYMIWAVTSFLRFRHVERRQLAPRIAPHLMAESHQLTVAELRWLRGAGRQVVAAKQLERMFSGSRD